MYVNSLCIKRYGDNCVFSGFPKKQYEWDNLYVGVYFGLFLYGQYICSDFDEQVILEVFYIQSSALHKICLKEL